MKTSDQVVTAILKKPDKPFSYRDLHKRVKRLPLGTVSSVISELKEGGLLTVEGKRLAPRTKRFNLLYRPTATWTSMDDPAAAARDVLLRASRARAPRGTRPRRAARHVLQQPRLGTPSGFLEHYQKLQADSEQLSTIHVRVRELRQATKELLTKLDEVLGK